MSVVLSQCLNVHTYLHTRTHTHTHTQKCPLPSPRSKLRLHSKLNLNCYESRCLQLHGQLSRRMKTSTLSVTSDLPISCQVRIWNLVWHCGPEVLKTFHRINQIRAPNDPEKRYAEIEIVRRIHAVKSFDYYESVLYDRNWISCFQI